MIRIIRQWLLSLDGGERDLWNQGYIVIYGGGTSFVLPVLSQEDPGEGRRNESVPRPGSLLEASGVAVGKAGVAGGRPAAAQRPSIPDFAPVLP